MTIPGAVLRHFSKITLGTADEKHYTMQMTLPKRIAIALIGIPHLGFRARARIILEKMREVPRSARILDAGAGYGIYSLMLAEEGYTVDALELEPERVQALAHLLEERPQLKERIHVQQGSLTSLPMKDASYDVIICSDVIEHIADDATAVREMARVLSPGGLLILTVPQDSSNNRRIYRMFGHERPGYSEASMLSLIAPYGLILNSQGIRRYEFTFGSILFKLHNYLRSPALMALFFYPFYALYRLDSALQVGEPNGIGFAIHKKGTPQHP